MLDKVIPFLSEWMFHYIRNKDIIAKSIEKIEEYINKSYIFVKYKEKSQVFFIEPEIKDMTKTLQDMEAAKKETGSDYSSLIILNSANNLKSVQENWKDLDKDIKFNIIFINPFSTLEKKWIIFPFSHSRIIEPESLNQGLNSLFDTVERIDLDSLARRIKQ